MRGLKPPDEKIKRVHQREGKKRKIPTKKRRHGRPLFYCVIPAIPEQNSTLDDKFTALFAFFKNLDHVFCLIFFQ